MNAMDMWRRMAQNQNSEFITKTMIRVYRISAQATQTKIFIAFADLTRFHGSQSVFISFYWIVRMDVKGGKYFHIVNNIVGMESNFKLSCSAAAIQAPVWCFAISHAANAKSEPWMKL